MHRYGLIKAFIDPVNFDPNMSFESVMEIFPNNSRPSNLGDSNWFMGRVWLEPILAAPAPARNRSVRVVFEPGARTAWHSHPLGQTLYVIAGAGLIGARDAPPQVIRAGDTVWIPPGQEHWHGAAPNAVMDQLSIQEAESGFVATWMEHVSDEDYLTPPA